MLPDFIVFIPMATIVGTTLIVVAVHVLIERGEKNRLRWIAQRVKRATRWKPRVIEGGKGQALEANEAAANEPTTGTEG